MLNFMYKIKVKQCLDQLEDIKKERDYAEFVRKTDEVVKLWNNVLKYKSTKIGISFRTF